MNNNNRTFNLPDVVLLKALLTDNAAHYSENNGIAAASVENTVYSSFFCGDRN